MTANDTRSYPGYLNKLVDKYNDIYHHSIGIKILMLTILFWLKKLNRVKKLLNLKLVIESALLFLAKVTLKIDQEKYLFFMCWKVIHGRINNSKNEKKVLWNWLTFELVWIIWKRK